MITLHELSNETQYLMQDFLFIERVNKTKALLTAVGVLPTLRQKQHELLHNNFAALFVSAYDKGGEFELSHISTFYSVKAGLPSKTYVMLQLMEAKGLLVPIGDKQWRITSRLAIAVVPLKEADSAKHLVAAK